MPKRFLLILCLSFSALYLQAQDQDSTAVDRLMRLGVRQMELGNYKAADLSFRKILNLRTFIPDELSYYYGNTLYQLKEYRLSNEFISRYIKLSDSNSTYLDTAYNLQNILIVKMQKIKECVECDKDGYKIELIECNVCSGDGIQVGPCNRCHGTGEEVCKVCFGEKVEIQKTSFGRRYVPCTNCNETGQVTCQKCDGEKVLDFSCKKCGGSGKLEKRVRVVE